MIKLRGHHLICLHFFHGKGYDDRFVSNLREIMRRAEDEEILVCAGADDVCSSCFHLKDSFCCSAPGAEDEIRAMDLKAFSLLARQPGEKIAWSNIRGRLPDIFNEWRASFCMECDWRGVCEEGEFFPGSPPDR